MAIGGAAASIPLGYSALTGLRRYYSTKVATPIMNQSMQLEKLPNIDPSFRSDGPTKLSFGLTLFQYSSCPFCCKARAFLDYFGLNYDIVEVDPVARNKLKWTSYRKVPTLLAYSEPAKNGDRKIYQINDSSVIISSLGSFLLSKRTLTSGEKSVSLKDRSIEDLHRIVTNYQSIEIEDDDGNKKQDIPNKYFLMLGDIKDFELEKRDSNLAEERRWRDWADSVLVHSISPNIYRTLPESYQAFQTFSVVGNWNENLTAFERFLGIYAGSGVMWLIAKRLKKRHNLKGDVRESLYDNCRLWMKAVGKDRKFMGGNSPNLADLSVFGVLSSFEGCLAFEDVMKNTNIGPWYSAVKECCHSHAGKDVISSI